ncbi:hypothetical protein [Mycobacterium sp.]|uniref:hypothetical protein n=1 Tax=Mycobacterium sp. TaxID=1785 RepID=UPI003C747799
MTQRIVRMAAAALVVCGLGGAGLWLEAGTAQAFSYPIGECNGMACSYAWCPGMPLPQPSSGAPAWDMDACHHFMIGKMSANSPAWVSNGGQNRQVSPMLIEGDPGPCPGCVS